MIQTKKIWAGIHVWNIGPVVSVGEAGFPL